MKIRLDYVTNSSSSGFIIVLDGIPLKELEKLSDESVQTYNKLLDFVGERVNIKELEEDILPEVADNKKNMITIEQVKLGEKIVIRKEVDYNNSEETPDDKIVLLEEY